MRIATVVRNRRQLTCGSKVCRLWLVGIGTALVLVCGLAAGRAEVDQAIVAVVNEDVISRRDLDNRLALYFVTSNLEDTPQARQQLTRDLVLALIDDSLKRQEARRLGISISRQELEQAMGRIAAQLNVPPEALPQLLASRGANVSTLLEQVETEIAWVRSLQRLAGAQVRVSNEDIAEELARMQANVGKLEYRAAEIFLPIGQASDEEQALRLAEELIRQIRAGARFSAAARSFSQSASAAVGGDIGYVRRGQLSAELDAALAELEPGQLSPPIRTPGGIYLLLMIDKRTTQAAGIGPVTVSLYQLHLPLAPGATEAEVQAQTEQAASISAGADSCEELGNRSTEIGSALSGSLGTVRLDQLPPEMRRIVEPLNAGGISAPVRSGDGVIVLMLCDRQQADGDEQTRNQIRGRLREERLTSASRRLLRDLRRSSLIDIRI